MNFLLKIVEGPNKGAEIALVEGVAVTIGKGDDCDIVLADPTMPDAPLNVDAAADGVSVNGERLEVLSVKTVGATSFAVGPADAPWGTLKWPKVGNGEWGTGNREPGTGKRGKAGTFGQAGKTWQEAWRLLRMPCSARSAACPTRCSRLVLQGQAGGIGQH